MSTAERRAALEIHGLSADDREWILGRLLPAQRDRIRPLLAELDGMNTRFELASLAIPRRDDPATDADSNAEQAPDRSAHSMVRRAPAADVLRCLADEPQWLVSAVLALDAWPWSAPVREALGGKDVASGEPSIGRGEPPPALAAALVSLLAERLPGPAAAPRPNGRLNGHHGAVDGIGLWGRFWPRARQWFR